MLQPGETTAVMAIVPVALGPQSLAWKHAGDNLQLLMAGTTLILQVVHPVVGAGVEQRSVFNTDPWGRLQRTTEWGLRYFALDPETYAWVYMTTYYAMVENRLEVTGLGRYLLDVSLPLLPMQVRYAPPAVKALKNPQLNRSEQNGRIDLAA